MSIDVGWLFESKERPAKMKVFLPRIPELVVNGLTPRCIVSGKYVAPETSPRSASALTTVFQGGHNLRMVGFWFSHISERRAKRLGA